MASRILTPANQITILRLAFIPFFAILVVAQEYRGALAVLTAAALSDMVDGMVARLLKQETPLGVALDPIADKLLMTTAYLTLAFRDALPWWLTILVIGRDVGIIITALLISLVAGYRPFRPTILGKASTAAQVATVFAAVSFQAHVPFVRGGLVQICVYLAAALTVVSGIHYGIVVRKRYEQHASEQAGEIK
ncbi:MAG: CDP-alcohol phosphatidyltransferase family protein [Terriglobia bacterium]|jgi:cardiolipin synthase